MKRPASQFWLFLAAAFNPSQRESPPDAAPSCSAPGKSLRKTSPRSRITPPSMPFTIMADFAPQRLISASMGAPLTQPPNTANATSRPETRASLLELNQRGARRKGAMKATQWAIPIRMRNNTASALLEVKVRPKTLRITIPMVNRMSFRTDIRSSSTPTGIKRATVPYKKVPAKDPKSPALSMDKASIKNSFMASVLKRVIWMKL